MQELSTKSSRLIEIANAIRAVQELRNKYPLHTFKPYEWQRKFLTAGGKYPYRMLMAANRVGKTFTAGCEIAYHATGIYPDWWEGRRFDHAPLIWVLGVSGEQIRDVVQALLFGNYQAGIVSGGLIRQDQIIDVVGALVVPRLMKDVRVEHPKGRSTISLKSYSQGQNVLMGSSVDMAWIDEEPQDPKIYPQVVIRTTTGDRNRGGCVIVTETPELGITELTRQFMDERGDGHFYMNATWNDAPHLDEETKRIRLQAIPEYQRDMRTKGIPVLGEGRVFTVAEERLIVDDLPIPGHWYRAAAIDFGIDHPTACVWVAHDRDSDVIYIYKTYRQLGEIPAVHASAINAVSDWIPVVYPHDGDITEKGSGETLADVYRRSGLDLKIKFRNPNGSNFVEPGLMEMAERMRTGRLKVFRSCVDWLEEYRRYHRNAGKIVKIDDDLIDASRYACLMVPFVGMQRGEEMNTINVPRHKRGLQSPRRGFV